MDLVGLIKTETIMAFKQLGGHSVHCIVIIFCVRYWSSMLSQLRAVILPLYIETGRWIIHSMKDLVGYAFLTKCIEDELHFLCVSALSE